jgi:hypothetical protein
MQLPEHRKNVFLYLCAFLQEVLCHMNDNGLDTKTIGELKVSYIEHNTHAFRALKFWSVLHLFSWT